VTQQITVLAGGVGGARFTRGLLAHLGRTAPSAEVTVVVNTGDDLWLDGLRVCPDLDTVMYTLGGVIGEQGWGRSGETSRVSAELHAYGLGWDWFTLGDLDLGTHIARTELLRSGLPLSAVTPSIALSGTTSTSPTDSNTAFANAMSSSRQFRPGAMADAPAPTSAGVFGMTRTTRAPFSSRSSM